MIIKLDSRCHIIYIIILLSCFNHLIIKKNTIINIPQQTKVGTTHSSKHMKIIYK